MSIVLLCARWIVLRCDAMQAECGPNADADADTDTDAGADADANIGADGTDRLEKQPPPPLLLLLLLLLATWSSYSLP